MDRHLAVDKITQASSGNPGCATVLAKVFHDHSEALSLKICDRMRETGTESHEVWQLYKDVCEQDMRITVDEFKRWLIEKPVPLRDKYEAIM
jgi:hypothetical protein